MRAKPTQVTMKRTAPTRPMRRPARMAKMTTEMVMTTKRPKGKPVRATWEAMNDCEKCQLRAVETEEKVPTANIGFSVANFDIFAMSSFRFSGGNMLSTHACPWLSMPPTVPWRAPVAPLIISAMFCEFGIATRVLAHQSREDSGQKNRREEVRREER